MIVPPHSSLSKEGDPVSKKRRQEGREAGRQEGREAGRERQKKMIQMIQMFNSMRLVKQIMTQP